MKSPKTRKSHMKSHSKSNSKSNRESHMKSPMKSPRKSNRKSPMKSHMKSPRKSNRKSSKMNLMNFSKNEILENLIISNTDEYPIYVKLNNKIVKIFLTIESLNEISLNGFYKNENENRKGIVRCAFLFLLEYLLKQKLITNEHICSVLSPTPNDGNIGRLIKIYKQIGFILYEPEFGNPINLKAKISFLISNLKKQCMDINYINKDDYEYMDKYNNKLYNDY